MPKVSAMSALKYVNMDKLMDENEKLQEKINHLESMKEVQGVPWGPVPGREGGTITVRASIPKTRPVERQVMKRERERERERGTNRKACEDHLGNNQKI